MNGKFISVPMNAKGVKEYDTGVEFSKNLKLIELSEQEFKSLLPVFNTINETLGLMIDDYESEIIEKNNIRQCLKILNDMSMTNSILYKALRDADKYRTFVGLDF